MRQITVCSVCGGKRVEYKDSNKVYCEDCEELVDAKEIFVESPYERTRSAVYATGNRWAIENFNATH